LTLLLGWGLLSAGCTSVVVYPKDLRPEWLAQPVGDLNKVPGTGPLTRPDSERIGPGDVLDVTIAWGPGEDGMSRFPVRVDNDGYADVLLIGEVDLLGLLPDQAERAIHAAGVRKRVFKRAHVVVIMKEQRVNRVTILGAVERPGVKELPRVDSHLSALVAEAEGYSDKASTIVEIYRAARIIPRRRKRSRGPRFDPRVRSEPVSYGDSSRYESENPNYHDPQYDEYDDEQEPEIERPGATIRLDLSDPHTYENGGMYLEDGDVVKVMPRDSQPIHVMGLVRGAGQFELEPNKNMRMLDALALAKGRSSQMADKVHIIRHLPGRAEPLVIQISVREAKLHGEGNLLLMPGDIVSVEQTPITMVLDTIKTFVRFTVGSSVALF
jgi:polysaccharide export outer membrane protein